MDEVSKVIARVTTYLTHKRRVWKSVLAVTGLALGLGVVSGVVFRARAESFQIGGGESTKLSPMRTLKDVMVGDCSVNIYSLSMPNFSDLRFIERIVCSRGVPCSTWGNQKKSMHVAIADGILIGNILQVGCYSDPRVHSQSWRASRIFEKHFEICSSSVVRRLSGNFIWHNPRSLIEHQGPATLLITEADKTQPENSYNYASNGDFVEFFGGSKLRSTILCLIGISLVFLGSRFLSYGDRVGDVAHEFWWWSGYCLSVVGGVIAFLAAVFGVGQMILL